MAKEPTKKKAPPIIENNGLDAPANTDPNDSGVLWESRVAALQREREGYVTRGMDDRVAAVDDELERLGYRRGAGNVAEDARSLPVAETSRRLPKETPSTPQSTSSSDQGSA